MEKLVAMPTRRRRLPSLLLLLAVLLIGTLLTLTPVAADGVRATEAANQAARPIPISTVADYLQVVNPRDTPLVLVIFDHTDAVNMEQVWQPMIQQLSANLGALSVGVVYAGASSEIGQTLLTQLLGQEGSGNALLFFNAILTPTGEEQGGFAKLPLAYHGHLHSEKILRWALQSISAQAISRVDTEADLAHLFSLYPGFPEMARVLYFTDAAEIGPVYKIVSQQLTGDAVFGVVQHPFATAEKKALAARYGVTSVPAVVVLHADPEHAATDLVQPLQGINVDTTVDELLSGLVQALPQSAPRIFARSQKSRDESALLHAHQRKMHVFEEMNRVHSEVISALREAELARPDIPTSQEAWASVCGELPPRHACLVAVAATAADVPQVADQLHDAAHRLFRTFADIPPAVVHRVVLDASRSPKLVEYFGAGKTGLPDVFVIEHRPGGKLVYHNFVGAFVPERLANFFATKLTSQTAGTSFSPRSVPTLLSGGTAGHDDDDDGGDL